MIKPLKLPETRACRVCGKRFVPYRPAHVYCCDEHQLADYNAKNDIAGRMYRLRARRKKEQEKESK
jgi:hypothetical protein